MGSKVSKQNENEGETTTVEIQQNGTTSPEVAVEEVVIADPSGGQEVQIVTTGPQMIPSSRSNSQDGNFSKRSESSLFELEKHMDSLRDIYTAKFARGILVFANIITLIFSCLLIYYGAAKDKGTHSTDFQETAKAAGEDILLLGELALNTSENAFNQFFDGNAKQFQMNDRILRPYCMVLAVGVSLMLISITGLLGSACPSRRIGKEVLFGYFSTVLVFICILLWGAVMCFQFQNETKRYVEKAVDRDWELIHPLVDKSEKTIFNYIEDNSNLVLSGAFCIVASAILTIALWASSKTMGHYFTVRKVLVSSSIAGAASGIVLLTLSIFYGAKNIGGSWAPGITAVAGVAILLLSGLGLYGVKSQNLLALVLHLFLLSILALFVSVVGVLIVSYPHAVGEMVHKHWKDIRHNVVHSSEKHFMAELSDNLLLLGSAALLFSILLIVSAAASFATCLEVYRKKKSKIQSTIQIRTV